jgi:hypothetical protein
MLRHEAPLTQLSSNGSVREADRATQWSSAGRFDQRRRVDGGARRGLLARLRGPRARGLAVAFLGVLLGVLLRLERAQGEGGDEGPERTADQRAHDV